MTEDELYVRGSATLIASWEAYAHGTDDAALRRMPGVIAAVFPHRPERGVYNNAVLDRGLDTRERAVALSAMREAYASAGVTRYAAWVHESDDAMRRDIEASGYVLDTTTRAMGMVLADVRLPRPELELACVSWCEYLRTFDLPANLLSRADHNAFELVVARVRAENVASALAFDFGGDRGIYNVGTVEGARRRGLGTAVTLVQVHDALARGLETASLQSTEIAERVYASVGFRDLGRILEYVPREAE
jgi:hypothetical protein